MGIFHPEKKPTLICDASDFGLGASHWQDGVPVFFASRKLTDTEQGYPLIEKELLAVVFGFQKFHIFLYGNFTGVLSDHMPLKGLVKKFLPELTLRQQRLMAKLLPYDLSVDHIAGKDNWLADFLSRHPQSRTDRPGKEPLSSLDFTTEDAYIHELDRILVSDKLIERISVAYRSDKKLQAAIDGVSKFWTKHS